MADNVDITAGSGTTIATDDVSGVQFQKIKLDLGGDGASSPLVRGQQAKASCIPVTLASDEDALAVTDNGGSLTVDNGGTFAVQVDAALPAGTNAIGKLAANSGVDIGDVDVTSVVPGTGATSLGKAVDSAAGGTDTGVAPLAVRDDALSSLAPVEGDYVPLRTDANGALWVIPSGTVTVGDGGSSLTVDNPTLSVTGGGTESGALRVTLASDSTGVLSVDDNGGSLTVDAAELTTLAGAVSGSEMQVDIVSSATLTVDLGANNDVTATGNVAHDAADSGNPVKVGMKAVAHGSNPTAVAASDRTDWYANRAGVPFVMGGHPNVQTVRANYTTAQTDAALVTVASGAKAVVTRVMVTADNANSVDVAVRVGFGTANTPTTTDVIAAHPGVPAGGGFATGDGSGILGVGADDEDIRVTSEVPTGGSIDVVVSYYTVPS